MTLALTPFTIVDADGNPLCHTPSQSKDGCDSKRKRAVREEFAAMIHKAGMVRADGMVQDVVTGTYWPMADKDTAPQNLKVVDRGHVIADARRGPFCCCNLIPELRMNNKAHKDAPVDVATFEVRDPREVWRALWFAEFAPAFKARKAV